MDIKQEDLIKFWLHFGFKSVHGRYYGLTYPDGKYQVIPQLTLDNLYQFAIPKLQDKGFIIELVAHTKNAKSKFHARVHRHDPFKTSFFKSDSPTEALYNAIIKVIQQEKCTEYFNPIHHREGVNIKLMTKENHDKLHDKGRQNIE
jgi:hypothetical protein